MKYPFSIWSFVFRCSAGIILFGWGVRAEVVTLQYEQAASPLGPWVAVDPAQVKALPDGTSSVVSSAPQAYYRLRIQKNGEIGALPLLPIQEVSKASLDVAIRHVQAVVQSTENGAASDEALAWRGAVFAPFAGSLLAGDGSVRSAYVEIKVMDSGEARKPDGFLANSSDEPETSDRGYMIVSLDRSDLPVLEYNTTGPTPTERLLERCGGKTPARIIRYGPTFWAAEDEAGNLIGNLGTEPPKIPAEYVNYMDRVYTGEIDSARGILQLPPELKLKLGHYANYLELKSDLERNPVHQLMRERRAQLAGFLWDLEEGKRPQILEMRLGETNIFLPEIQIGDYALHWEENERPLADITILRTGGFRAVARQAGSAPLTLRTSKGLESYVLLVRSSLVGRTITAQADSTPYWRSFTWVAGEGWADQAHYYQLRSDNWCNLVGCGPTALAMLFAYWDRQGVESAFYYGSGNTLYNSLRLSDAPQELDSSSEPKIRLLYNNLHDLCDVICNPFGNDGATWPGDLIEGFYGYLYPVAYDAGPYSLIYGKGNNLINISCSWAWDAWGSDWQESGRRVAEGIRKGRPGVIGLGWLWHYGVAYAYKRKELVANVGGQVIVLQVNRYLKVNEGWRDMSPSWYSAYDVFLGLSCSLSQARAPQLP